MAKHDHGIALLDELIRAQLEPVPRANHLLEDLDRRLLSLVAPRAGKLRIARALPNEVVAPKIQRSLEIALTEALVAVSQRVGLAGHTGLLSSTGCEVVR